MQNSDSSKFTVMKAARILVYLVYAWLVIATVFLFLGFILLLLGANPNTPFVHFVYHVAAHFLQPFRGMFPTTQISDTSYFSAAGLFAIIFYSIIAFFVHALIEYITMKLQKNELELETAQRQYESAARTQAPRSRKPAK